MQKATKAKWLQYGVTTLVGLAVAIPLAFSRGFVFDGDTVVNAAALSDGCFVAAVLLCGVGILAWTATTGFFDIFSYGFKSLLVLFSSVKHPDDHMHYADYKAMKELKRGKTIHFILYVGLVFLGLAGLFLAVYYSG